MFVFTFFYPFKSINSEDIFKYVDKNWWMSYTNNLLNIGYKTIIISLNNDHKTITISIKSTITITISIFFIVMDPFHILDVSGNWWCVHICIDQLTLWEGEGMLCVWCSQYHTSRLHFSRTCFQVPNSSWVNQGAEINFHFQLCPNEKLS